MSFYLLVCDVQRLFLGSGIAIKVVHTIFILVHLNFSWAVYYYGIQLFCIFLYDERVQNGNALLRTPE